MQAISLKAVGDNPLTFSSATSREPNRLSYPFFTAICVEVVYQVQEMSSLDHLPSMRLNEKDSFFVSTNEANASI